MDILGVSILQDSLDSQQYEGYLVIQALTLHRR